MCNIIEPVGFDDISNGDLEELSKSFTGGRRHAIGTTDNNTISLMDGMFAKQLDGGKRKYITLIIWLSSKLEIFKYEYKSIFET